MSKSTREKGKVPAAPGRGHKEQAREPQGKTPESKAPPRKPDQESSDLERRFEELEAELARAREEEAAAADRALRTLAEFDNYRKRTGKERIEATAIGKAQVLRELLDVADNFDRALEHAGDQVPEHFLDGMRLVARGLHDLLERHSVSRIEAVGSPFDPELHEAISSLPSAEAAPNSVLQEIQTGYTMDGRVLRPAKVIVATRPPKEIAAADGKEGSERGDAARAPEGTAEDSRNEKKK